MGAGPIIRWAEEHAPGRPFTIAEVAAALRVRHPTAKTYLARMVTAGLLVRCWDGAFALPGAGPFTDPKPGTWAGRIAGWAAREAPDRPFTTAEVAAGLDLLEGTAQAYLSRMVSAGLLARCWRGAFAVPDAGPFTAPDPAADLILAFIAADGGATWRQLRDRTAVEADTISPQLLKLRAAGRVVRLDWPGERAGFYVLPGQQPGEIRPWPDPGPGDIALTGRTDAQDRIGTAAITRPR